MGYEQVNFIYLSEILGLPVLLADGSRIGRIIDLAATPSQVYPKVTGLILLSLLLLLSGTVLG